MALFRLGRRNQIRKRAADFGRLLQHLVSCVETQLFEEFVEARLREGFVESYTDRVKKEFGFFASDPHQDKFSFHAVYEPSARVLIVEGHHRYYGMQISGSSLGQGVSIGLSEMIERGFGDGKLGRDAKALRAELLQFPGFHSFGSLKAQLLG